MVISFAVRLHSFTLFWDICERLDTTASTYKCNGVTQMCQLRSSNGPDRRKRDQIQMIPSSLCPTGYEACSLKGLHGPSGAYEVRSLHLTKRIILKS